MYDAAERRMLAEQLADAFLSSPWRAELIAENGAGRLDQWPSWMTALSLAVVAVHRSAPVDRRYELIELIEDFLAEHPARPEEAESPVILFPSAVPEVAQARRRLRHDWPIAEIASVGELAERLELSVGQLAWLADVRGLERTVSDEKLRNYRYRGLPRAGALPRVIEAPKLRLKEVQRWLLHQIFDQVTSHEAAHGFIAGRSAATHAALHLGQAVVMRMDLKDFFASVAARRVYGIFRTLGYDRSVAHVLTGICTNSVPQTVWQVISRLYGARLVQPGFWLGRQLATPHLPQGAPTSPAVANLAAFRLDRRLNGLAIASGARYSRYADDLTFSGPKSLSRRRAPFQRVVAQIVREEGFALNDDKTVVRGAAGRQLVCGVVVNARPNVARAEYDQLRAILNNCARHGPGNQNRAGVADLQAHLRGRISWFASLNPDRGEKLRRQFAEIAWD